jgi:hypothetical protein
VAARRAVRGGAIGLEVRAVDDPDMTMASRWLLDGGLRAGRRPMWLAAASFGVFLLGAGATMWGAGVFDATLLLIAAAFNVVAMLTICVVTSAVLEVGRHAEREERRERVVRRTLHLASMYWTAAGLAFLLSPLLAQI